MTVFIQEHSGNHNLDGKLPKSTTKQDFVNSIRTNGGYFVDNTFVPWHRIDFIKFEE